MNEKILNFMLTLDANVFNEVYKEALVELNLSEKSHERYSYLKQVLPGLTVIVRDMTSETIIKGEDLDKHIDERFLDWMVQQKEKA